MKVETQSGRGALWKDDIAVVLLVPYSVTITTPDVGLRRIDGSIDADFEVLTQLMMEEPPPKLVLELEDGRRWECYLASNDGRLVNRGGLK